jgi:hypothetical protein
MIAHPVKQWGSLSGHVPTQKRCVERTLPAFPEPKAPGIPKDLLLEEGL